MYICEVIDLGDFCALKSSAVFFSESKAYTWGEEKKKEFQDKEEDEYFKNCFEVKVYPINCPEID